MWSAASATRRTSLVSRRRISGSVNPIMPGSPPLVPLLRQGIGRRGARRERRAPAIQARSGRVERGIRRRACSGQLRRSNRGAVREDGRRRAVRSTRSGLADDAKRAYEHFKIGVWHLEQDDPGEALRSAVEQDIVEAEPLLEICLQALESIPAGRAAYDDEHEAAAADRQVGLSATEDDQELDDGPGGETTPIYDAVTDGVVDDRTGVLDRPGEVLAHGHRSA
jgi:hypothetical protein